MFGLTHTTCIEEQHTDEVPDGLRDRFPTFDVDGFAAKAVCASRGRRLCMVWEFDALFQCRYADGTGREDPRAAGCVAEVPRGPGDGPLAVGCEFANGGPGAVNARGVGQYKPVIVEQNEETMVMEFGGGVEGYQALCFGDLAVRCCLDL